MRISVLFINIILKYIAGHLQRHGSVPEQQEVHGHGWTHDGSQGKDIHCTGRDNCRNSFWFLLLNVVLFVTYIQMSY